MLRASNEMFTSMLMENQGIIRSSPTATEQKDRIKLEFQNSAPSRGTSPLTPLESTILYEKSKRELYKQIT
jgi:hypothetical protein